MINRPNRVVIIAASPRTGSNLLCRGLSATGVVGDPQEDLIPLVQAMERGELPWRALTARGVAGRIRRRLKKATNWRRVPPSRVRRVVILDHLRQSAVERTGPNGTYAIKLMWGHFGGTMLVAGVDVDVWAAPVTWIHVRRVDKLAQAVSWIRAEQSDQWTAERAALAAIEYDRDRIVALEAQARREEAAWRELFHRRRIAPIEVVYEDLLGDYESTMRRVLDELGHADVAVPPPQTVRQSDELSIEWVDRVRVEGMQ